MTSWDFLVDQLVINMAAKFHVKWDRFQGLSKQKFICLCRTTANQPEMINSCLRQAFSIFDRPNFMLRSEINHRLRFFKNPRRGDRRLKGRPHTNMGDFPLLTLQTRLLKTFWWVSTKRTCQPNLMIDMPAKFYVAIIFLEILRSLSFAGS